MAKKVKKISNGNGLYTDMHIILDRSGSMENIRQSTIDGFNKFLNEQKMLPDKATISLYQFDDIYEVVYKNKDLQDAPDLNTTTFVPRNSTALLDAIGRTINGINTIKKPDKIVVVIITDGQENSSKEFIKTTIFDMIREKTNAGWAFVFLAANQDAIASGSSLGIFAQNSKNYVPDKHGTIAAYATASSCMRNYRTQISSLNSLDNEEVQANALFNWSADDDKSKTNVDTQNTIKGSTTVLLNPKILKNRII